MLIAAFRATLEEVIEADVILHVRDISHADADAQSRDVVDILRELGIEPDDKRMIEIWNKIDRLPAERRAELQNLIERQPQERRPVSTSAVTGEGVGELKDAIEARLSAGKLVIDLALDPADGAGLSWLHRHSEVLAKSMNQEGKLVVTLRADAATLARVRAKFSPVKAD
jgi:GTP-binding protein HflX